VVLQADVAGIRARPRFGVALAAALVQLRRSVVRIEVGTRSPDSVISSVFHSPGFLAGFALASANEYTAPVVRYDGAPGASAICTS